MAVDPPRPDPKELNYQLWEELVRYIIPYVGMPLTQHVISNLAGKSFQHLEREKGLFNLIISGQFIEIQKLIN